jgi:hypothetical protein
MCKLEHIYSVAKCIPFEVCKVTYDALTTTDLYVYWSLMPSKTTGRKYEVTIPTSAVKDALHNFATAALTTSWITAGSISADGDKPDVRTGGYSPALDAAVAVTSNVVLYFNEDVQKGSPGYGPPMVYWCLNSDATSNTTCDAGRFHDNTTASYEIVSSDITNRRTLTINPAKNFAIGQKLYVLMPESTLSDCSTAGNGMTGMTETKYSFTVVDQDTVNMHLDWYHTTTLFHGNLQILFSEAVQAGGVGVTVDQIAPTTSTGIGGVTSTISGNLVTISKTSWTAGKKYRLNVPANAFRDLKGNPSDAVSTNTVTFVIDADGTNPTATLKPSAFTSAFDTHDALTIEFNEVVQAGSGKVSIFSGSSLVTSAAASDLSLVSFVKGNKRISSVTMDIAWGKSTPPECGTAFSFKVDSTAFRDLADNQFTQRSSTTFSSGNSLHDTTAPSLTSVDLGDAPNPAFSASTLVMYFTEVVQSDTTKNVYLAGSLGGNFCGPSVAGGCPVNETATCNQFCDYDNATTTSVALSTLTFSGAKVTAAVPTTLETGKGYKLMIDAGKFKDVIGNTISAVDGEDGTVGAFTLQVGTAATVSSSDSTAPVYATIFPEGNTNMVAPSTTVQLTFTETVQAGTGTLSIGATTVDASACYYQGMTVTCKPAGDLALDTEYSVTYSAGLVKDAAGNAIAAPAATFATDFTTININYNPAALPTAGTGYAPAALDDIIPKGTVVALSFAETVQAGTGAGNNINVGGKTVSATSSSATFIGNMLYVMPPILTAGTSHTVTASAGAIKTASGTNVAVTPFTFTVAPDDTTEPAVLGSVPKNSLVGTNAITTDIMLYFSEAVQAVATKAVTVTDGASATSYAIPVDNTNPAKGEVYVLDPGSLVFVNPFDDMSFGSTVTVTSPVGAFTDYFDQQMFAIGSAGAGGSFTASYSSLGAAYQFSTDSFGFNAIKSNNATVGFSARQGAISYYTNSTFVLYSGKGPAGCLSDLYTSTTGSTWAQVTGVTTTDGSAAPKAANAPTAMDANGCIWLLGGECNSYAGTIWKSCDAGKTWKPMPSPSSVPFAGSVAFPPPFPTKWSGHAIAIVGGWQLVIVQASAGGGVWRFTSETLELVQLVATAPLPFGTRNDPKLLTTSDNKLYLIGGHTCKDLQCSNNEVFNDVWMSSNVGETWTCQTSTIDPSMVSSYSRGMGRYTTAVMTGDDTIFLMGGLKANSTEGLNKVYTSFLVAPDQTFNGASPYLVAPQVQPVLKTFGSVSVYFQEAVQLGTGAITFVKDGTTTVSASALVDGESIILSPNGANVAGSAYALQMPAGSVKDLYGNALLSSPIYTFTVNADATAPTVTGRYPSTGATKVESQPTITLTMSESVQKGTGLLSLVSGTGKSFTLDVATATIAYQNDGVTPVTKVFFSTAEAGVTLTEGAKYTIKVAAGMLKDVAGNSMAVNNNAGIFTVISGSTSINDYEGTNFTVGAPGTGNATLDTVAPTFVSMFPGHGATDVPSTKPVGLMMYFSEPVKFNDTGIISIKNQSNVVVGMVNLTTDTTYVISPTTNATKFVIPSSVLVKGQRFTVSIPTGVIKDFAGNALAGISKMFTCLAETADTTAPVVTMASQGVGVRDKIDLYFSEDISAGSGTITVTGMTPAINTQITHSNVTISGATLSLSLYTNALSKAASYSVQIPPGALKDAAGSLFAGLNGTSMSFLVADPLDTDAPTLDLSDCRPPTESSLTYQLPVTTSLRLTFNEPVQTAVPFGQGITAVTLTPKYGYAADQTVSITTDQLFIDDTDVMLFPTMATSGGALMAGEVYSVTVSSTAFKDMTSNFYGGLTTGYTISTKRQMNFMKSSSATGEWGAGISYFTGERYASGAVVDASNVVYMIGGVNGTMSAFASGSMMNDVWSYATKRETSCASSFVPLGTCPQTTCTTGSDGKATLGSVAVKRTVWRAPSASGAPCMDGATEVRTLWGAVTTEAQVCPCPMCLSGPGADGTALPTYMTNTSYVNAYTLVSAAPTMHDLHCVDGKIANGSFTCVVDTPYVGKFQKPYPECIPAPCTSPPVSSGVANLAMLDIAGSTDSMNCSALNSTNSIKSGGVCAMKCKPGYKTADGGFVCFEGVFGSASCDAQTCDIKALGISHGTLDCKSGSAYTDECAVKCDAGYKASTSGVTAKCDTDPPETTTPEAAVSFKLKSGTPSTVCEMIKCEAPTTSNGKFTLTSGEGITAVWTLECNAGSVAKASSGLTAKCTGDGTLTNAAGDASLPECESAPACSGEEAAAKGVEFSTGTDCPASLSEGDECKTTCETGKTVVGSFTCRSGSLTGFSTCYDSSDTNYVTETVTTVSSTISLVFDLSGVTFADAVAAVSKSLAKALGVPAGNVAVDKIEEVARRLDASSQRRLAAKKYEISYQVIVPDGMDPSDLAAKASDIATPGSAVAKAFTAAMQSESLPVSGIKMVAAPRTYTSTVVKGKDGIMIPKGPSAAKKSGGGGGAPAPVIGGAAKDAEEDSGGGAGAIIGGVIGGLVGVCICGAAVYFLVFRKKGQQE